MGNRNYCENKNRVLSDRGTWQFIQLFRIGNIFSTEFFLLQNKCV